MSFVDCTRSNSFSRLTYSGDLTKLNIFWPVFLSTLTYSMDNIFSTLGHYGFGETSIHFFTYPIRLFYCNLSIIFSLYFCFLLAPSYCSAMSVAPRYLRSSFSSSSRPRAPYAQADLVNSCFSSFLQLKCFLSIQSTESLPPIIKQCKPDAFCSF